MHALRLKGGPYCREANTIYLHQVQLLPTSSDIRDDRWEKQASLTM